VLPQWHRSTPRHARPPILRTAWMAVAGRLTCMCSRGACALKR
jgi:hypothetical protein